METVTVTATLFVPPNGKRREIEIKNVYPDDAAYIKEHDIKVSLEELMTGDTVIYFDDGKHFCMDEDGVEDDTIPDEIIIISKGGSKSCEECIKAGVAKLKARLTK